MTNGNNAPGLSNEQAQKILDELLTETIAKHESGTFDAKIGKSMNTSMRVILQCVSELKQFISEFTNSFATTIGKLAKLFR